MTDGDEAFFGGGGHGRIGRDRWGVPHLAADDLDTLAYLQGRVTAQDRAWQLECERRRGEGTLAEAVGRDAVPWDTFARTVDLEGTARRAYRACAPGTRRWLQAYAAGVRSGLGEGAAAAPEFERTPVGPGRWEPWTPLAVFLVQQVLFSTFPHKLWRARVASAFRQAGPDGARSADEAVRILGTSGDDRWGAGSQAWAVPGRATVSGMPLLGGEPHRLLEIPGIYQQVHLSTPDVHVVGLAFPGVPGVQHVGRTATAAWAVTHAMADYQDLVVEPLRRRRGVVQCQDEGGAWVAADEAHALIAVADADPVEVEIVRTPRGPVISGGPDDGTGLSLRTPSGVLGDLGFDALPALLRARDVDEVEAAFAGWVEPVNSVLAVDARPPHGTVRSFVAGRVPQRDRAAMMLPVALDRAVWTRWLPLSSRTVDEPVVHANEERPGETAELGTSFAPGHRGRRIAALMEEARRTDPLGGAGAHRLATGLAMDTLLGPLDAVRAAWSAADEPGGSAADAVTGVRARLLAWDGRMDAGSTEAALFARWRHAFVRRLSRDPVIAPLHGGSGAAGHPELFSPWLDVTAQLGDHWAAVLTRGARLGLDVDGAVRGALQDVAELLGSGAAENEGEGDAPWGRLHRLLPLATAPSGDAPQPARWDAAGVAVGGDADCVLATSCVPGVTPRTVRGPVARYVWDLADASGDGWVVPFGSSGRPADVHALDQLEAWRAGRLLPVRVPEGELTIGERDVVAWAGGLLDPPERGQAGRTLLAGGETLTLSVLDPETDADLVHAWTSAPRARYWGLTDASVEQVRSLYRQVDALVTHHAFLIRADDAAVGLLQTYRPEYDPVAEAYPVQQGDVGIHVLLGPAQGIPGRAAVLGQVFGALVRLVFEDPRVRRVVAEPDAANRAALARLHAEGFTVGPEVAVGDKIARLAFLERRWCRSEQGDAVHRRATPCRISP